MVVIKSYCLQCILCTTLIATLLRETKGDNLLNLDTAVIRSKPGFLSPSKAWWAKEVTPDFYIAGRLTERQMKYASEAGFRSILSLFIYDTDEQVSFGGEYLPTTAEAWTITHSAGQQYVALIKHSDDWGSVETVQKFGKVIETLQRPVLLHCDRGYTITFVTLMYMANQTRYNSSFEPKIYSENFFRITAAMGLDFTHDDLKQVVANITGESVVLDPPKPNCKPSEWLDFWLAHPVFGNWYTAGQIRKCDVKVLEETRFRSVVNMRLGVTHNNEPSQEEVTLLNVKDGISSYGKGDRLPRQHPQTLEANRLNKHVPLEYISQSSRVNYEKTNLDEFGDNIGYNETMEKEFFKHSTLKYYHIPICEY